jgi:hypothetical protein
MTPPRVLAALSGLALGAAATGASNALIAMPLPFIVTFGASGALLALAHPRHRWTAAALLACGMALGMALPRSAPQARGEVVTHAIRGWQRGDLFQLLDRIDADPHAVLGHRISVAGEWSRASNDRAATVSRRVMTCCAADMVRVGFDVLASPKPSLAESAPVHVSGILRSQLVDGDLRYVIQNAGVEAFQCPTRPCSLP